MLLKSPKVFANVEAFKPVLDHLETVYITATELADHWRMSPDHVSNLRRAGKGPGFLRLETGRILYPMADVIRHELRAAHGSLTLDHVCLAVTAAPLSADDKAKVIAHLKATFRG